MMMMMVVGEESWKFLSGFKFFAGFLTILTKFFFILLEKLKI